MKNKKTSFEIGKPSKFTLFGRNGSTTGHIKKHHDSKNMFHKKLHIEEIESLASNGMNGSTKSGQPAHRHIKSVHEVKTPKFKSIGPSGSTINYIKRNSGQKSTLNKNSKIWKKKISESGSERTTKSKATHDVFERLDFSN